MPRHRPSGKGSSRPYEDRYIETVYEHYGGEVVERVLEAYSLVAKSSIWYLTAAHDGELRTYRVSRFKQVAARPALSPPG